MMSVTQMANEKFFSGEFGELLAKLNECTVCYARFNLMVSRGYPVVISFTRIRKATLELLTLANDMFKKYETEEKQRELFDKDVKQFLKMMLDDNTKDSLGIREALNMGSQRIGTLINAADKMLLLHDYVKLSLEKTMQRARSFDNTISDDDKKTAGTRGGIPNIFIEQMRRNIGHAPSPFSDDIKSMGDSVVGGPNE